MIEIDKSKYPDVPDDILNRLRKLALGHMKELLVMELTRGTPERTKAVAVFMKKFMHDIQEFDNEEMALIVKFITETEASFREAMKDIHKRN